MWYCFKIFLALDFPVVMWRFTNSSAKPALFLISNWTTLSKVAIVSARSTATYYVFYLVKLLFNVFICLAWSDLPG